MQIASYSSTNQPFANNGINSSFFGATVSAGGAGSTEVITVSSPPVVQQFTVQPPPYTTTVSVQPPSITQVIDGVPTVIDFPPIQQQIVVTPPPIVTSVTVTPPSQQKTIVTPGGSATVKNAYESVGIVDGAPPKLVALVRPNVVAGAKHYALVPGNKVTFYSSNGPVSSTVKGVAGTYGDLELYYLNDSISGVQPVAIPTFAISAFTGRPIVTFGLVGSRSGPYNWTPAAVAMKIARVTASSGVWTATCTNPTLQSFLEPGDSGGPNFFTDTTTSILYYLGSTHEISSTFTVNVACPWASQINSL